MRPPLAALLLLVLLALPQCAHLEHEPNVLQLIPPIEDLPEPFVLPRRPETTRYSAGHCEHNGGSIAEWSILFADGDFSVALDCSRRRCEAGDRIGCRDTAALYLNGALGGAERPDPGFTYALRGCDLGDGESCALAADVQAQSAPDLAIELYARGCIAGEVAACSVAGSELLKRGDTSQAVPMLVRGCRGQLDRSISGKGIDYVPPESVSIESFGQPSLMRFGCGDLAALAKKHGDDAAAYQYGRLECLHGILSKLAWCLEAAQISVRKNGAEDVETQILLREGCQAVCKTELEEDLCRNLKNGERPRGSRFVCESPQI